MGWQKAEAGLPDTPRVEIKKRRSANHLYVTTLKIPNPDPARAMGTSLGSLVPTQMVVRGLDLEEG